MIFQKRTVARIAEMICGNPPRKGENYFKYRSSSYLTQFFEDCDTDFRHDGSTRDAWVMGVLTQILSAPSSDPKFPPPTFCRAISLLMDREDATNEGPDRKHALDQINDTLAREGFEAFYAEDRQCYLRSSTTKAVANSQPNPHRPFSTAELKKREQLSAYLDKASEDDFIGEILLPLLRQLGFHRVTAAGHKDKQLEYGKDLWMKYTLPTTHVLYFGLQAKRDKLDAAGDSKSESRNIAEIYNQVLMMLGHEIFDPETSRRVLVDHAFVVAGGEITKAARNWLGNKLDASKRSQIMFMDREDILNLFVATNLPLPDSGVFSNGISDDDIPF